MTGYTTRDVAELLGLSASRVRAWCGPDSVAGSRPRGEFHFSFRDLVLLKAVRELLDDRHLPPQDPALAREPARGAAQGPPPDVRLRIQATGSGSSVGRPHGVGAPSGQFPDRLRVADFGRAGAADRPARGEERNPGRRPRRGRLVRPRRRPRGGRPVGGSERVSPFPGTRPGPRGRTDLGRLVTRAGDALAAAEHYRRALRPRPTARSRPSTWALALEPG